MKMLHMVAFTLVLVGAVNWGLIAVFSGFNLVTYILGTSALTSLVYLLVGLSAVYLVFTHSQDCKVCAQGKKK